MNNEIKIMAKAGLMLLAIMLFTVLAIDSAKAAWEPITQCWVASDEREDGSPMDISEIVEYQIWYNETNHGLDWELAWTVPNNVGCVTYTPQGTGDQVCFYGYTRATGTDIPSQRSNETCHTPVEIAEDLAPPNPLFMNSGAGGG